MGISKEIKKHIESLIEDIINRSIEESSKAVVIDEEFQKKVDKWIGQFNDDDWIEKFTCFIAEQLFEYGYNVIAAIDKDDYWNNSLKVVKRGKDYESELSEDFFLRNTFLEIFAVDRKADPMIFDDRINDPDFGKGKVREILECNINLIAGQLEGLSVSEIYDNNYEKFDAIIQRRKSYE